MSRTHLKRRDPHALDAMMRKADRFPDKRKESNRRACRGKVTQEN